MPTDDRLELLEDELVVERAAVVWARRLRGKDGVLSPRHLANQASRLLVTELGAHHVALWEHDLGDLVVLGADGLNPRLRNTRLSLSDPALVWARASGGTHRWHPEGDRLPRTSGVPDALAHDYTLLVIEDPTPIALVTISGVRTSPAEEAEIRALMSDLRWA